MTGAFAGKLPVIQDSVRRRESDASTVHSDFTVWTNALANAFSDSWSIGRVSKLYPLIQVFFYWRDKKLVDGTQEIQRHFITTVVSSLMAKDSESNITHGTEGEESPRPHLAHPKSDGRALKLSPRPTDIEARQSSRVVQRNHWFSKNTISPLAYSRIRFRSVQRLRPAQMAMHIVHSHKLSNARLFIPHFVLNPVL